MSEQSLKTKTTIGLLWNAVDKFAGKASALAVEVLLARLLMPSDYGLIGMLAIFIALSGLFIDSGFGMALVQKHNRTELDYSTIFYFNLAVAVGLYLLLFITAPFIARFFNTPQLTLLTRVLSLTLVVNSLSLVQQTRLSIALDFKTQALVSLFAMLISGIVAIYTAYRGFGVWALVFQSISSSLIRTLTLFYFSKWMPRLVFSMASFKQLFGFSSKLLGTGLIQTIQNNMYTILIGKILTVKDLGYYTNGRQYPEALSTIISQVITGVAFPVLASLQNERERMLAACGRLMRVTGFFLMPMLTMLALLAAPAVHFFLTDKWMPIVRVIQWLCFSRMMAAFNGVNVNILTAFGRSDLYFKVEIAKSLLPIIILLMTISYGVEAVAAGLFFSTVIAFFIYSYYPGKLFGFSAIRQIKEMMTVIYATLLMAACVYGITLILPGDFLKLIIGGTAGIGVYLAVAYLMKMQELDDIKEMIQTIFLKKLVNKNTESPV